MGPCTPTLNAGALPDRLPLTYGGAGEDIGDFDLHGSAGNAADWIHHADGDQSIEGSDDGLASDSAETSAESHWSLSEAPWELPARWYSNGYLLQGLTVLHYSHFEPKSNEVPQVTLLCIWL